MTDGTISTIVSLLVGMLATSVASVVVSRARQREREHEALYLRDARIRAELQLLEIRAGELRTQIAELEDRRTRLLQEVPAAPEGGDPPQTSAADPVIRTAQRHAELDRRLRDAGDAHVIPFPFLAEDRSP